MKKQNEIFLDFMKKESDQEAHYNTLKIKQNKDIDKREEIKAEQKQKEKN